MFIFEGGILMYIPFLVILFIVWLVWRQLSNANKKEQELKNIIEKKEQEISKKNQIGAEMNNLGCFEGEKITQHTNGTVATIANYKDGKLDGEFKHFQDTGEIWSHAHYKNGELHGTRKFYYRSGSLDTEQQWENGLLVGSVKSYYENGKLKTDRNHIDGKEHGISKEYYEIGELKSEYSYKMGLKHGVCKTYFKDGSVESESYFENDKAEGNSKAYFEDGHVKKEANYIGGNGASKEFYDTGELNVETIRLENGIEKKRYYRNGKISSNSKTLNQYWGESKLVWITKKDSTTYYINGNPKVVFSYSYHYDWETTKTLKENLGTEKGYYESGKIKYEETFKGLDRYRKLLNKKRFLESGQPYEGIYLVKDVEDDEYGQDGQVLVKEIYVNGDLDGVVVFYNDDKKVKEEINFKKGVRDGKTTEYDEEGNVELVALYENGKEIESREYLYCHYDESKQKLISESHHDYIRNTSWTKEFTTEGRLEKHYVHDKNSEQISTFYKYFESGKIKEIDVWQGDEKRKKIYYETGELFSEEIKDKEFKTDGVLKYYYKAGKAFKETQFVHGLKHGYSRLFNEDGKIIAEDIWENNNKTNSKVYDKKSKEILDGMIDRLRNSDIWVMTS